MYPVVTRAYINILRVYWKLPENKGYAVAQLLEAMRYMPKCRGFDRPRYGTDVDLATKRNAAGAEGWQFDHLCEPIVQKFQGPQPPGALRVCPGL